MKIVNRRVLSFTLLMFLAIAPSWFTARAASLSNATLKGSYSYLIDRWTADLSTDQFGMVGIMKFNGTGGVTGTFTSMTATTVSSGTLSGTYSVSATGAGTITLTSGSTAQFAIALNSVSSGVARGVQLLQTNDSSNEVISGSAVLQSAVPATYNLASLTGVYTVQLNTWTDDSTLAEDGDLAVFSFDGKGHFKGTVSSMFDGSLFTNSVSGSYTVNTNGTGTLTVISNNSPQFAIALNTVTSGLAAGAQILATNPGNGSGNYVIAGSAAKQ